MNTIILRINNATQTIAEHQIVSQDGAPTIIEAIDQVNYELIGQDTGVAPQHIMMQRQDNDLLVYFDEDAQQADLIVENYYTDATNSAFIGPADNGGYYYYIPDTGEVADFVTELAPGDIEGQALGGPEQAGPWWAGAAGLGWLPWLAGLLALAGLAAALAGGDDDDAPAADTTPPSAPDSVAIGNGDDYITVDEIDGNGNVDVTVDLPSDAVAGDTVQVKDDNGNVIGEHELTDNDINAGEVVIDVPAPDEGQALDIDVTITDEAGNESDPTSDSATRDTAIPGDVDNDGSVKDPNDPTQPDTDDNDATTKDGAPIITFPEDVDGNGILNVDENGNSKDTTPVHVSTPANTEAGDTVVITINGVEQEVPITDQDIANGYVSIDAPVADADGDGKVDDIDIEAYVKDPAGNQSNTGTATLEVDVSIPGDVDNDGSVKDPNDPTQPDTDDNDTTTQNGAPIITFPEDVDGNGILNVDENGDSKDTTPVHVSTPANTEAGDTVVVTINGVEQEVPITDQDIANGFVSIDAPVADADGDGKVDDIDIEAYVKDPAGNQSNTGTATLEVDVSIPGDVDNDGSVKDPNDPTQPDTDDNDTTTQNGAPIITFPEDVNGNNDGILNKAENGNTSDSTPVRVSLPANTEVGDTVVLTLDGGSPQEIVVTATDLGNGYIEVEASITATTTEITAEAFVKDPAGNQSNTATAELEVDTTGPNPNTTQIVVDDITADNTINANEATQDIPVTGTVSGEFQDGDTVTITVNGNNFTGTVDANGKFNIIVDGINLAADPDTTVDVVVDATDPAGNTAPVSTTKTYDVVPGLSYSPTVEITDDVNNDEYLNAAELGNNSVVNVKVTVPSEALIGDELTIKDQAGNDLGLGTYVVGTDVVAGGELTLTADRPDEGQPLVITAVLTDSAGNLSVAADNATVDTTPPDMPTILIADDANDDGFLNIEEIGTNTQINVEIDIPSTAEADDVLTITDQNDTVIGTYIIGTDANAGDTVTVLADRPDDGQELNVTASLSDPAGNASQVSDSATVDITAPSDPKITPRTTNELIFDANGDFVRRDAQGAVRIESGTDEDTDVLTFTYTDETYNANTDSIGVTHEATVFRDVNGSWNWFSFDGQDAVANPDVVQSALLLESTDLNNDGTEEAVITINQDRLLDGSEVTAVNSDTAGNLSNTVSDNATEDDDTGLNYNVPQIGFVDSAGFSDDAFTGEIEHVGFLDNGVFTQISPDGNFEFDVATNNGVIDGYGFAVLTDEANDGVGQTEWTYDLLFFDSNFNQVYANSQILREVIQ